ncbi:nuclease-related domain-containing protein [Metabacillus halosaccharovorans]|uniref:NERD domain-containing protein n=1 Tax=Metabacillus halosaccharovorans TaxID=930124 RepID=A0ABT3DDI2_9BACI|nr:nuclease-related domain-containing protein [Metabacillus halosaccharovorans]MCV9885112.1 NERD domain-containing protein [Metabacillus halosaccharovorans]
MKLLSSLFKKKEQVKEHTSQIMPIPLKEKHNEKVATRKGVIGEYKIDIQLAQLPKEYIHLSDIMLKNDKAKSGYSQIDHIVITSYGIFVIETKNYQGTIYGGKDRKTWSVNGKYKMLNPFIQNYGHIQAIKNHIEEKYHNSFISMVSFTKRCTFKIDELDFRKMSSDDLIVYDVELSEYIHRKVSVNKIYNKEPILKEDKIKRIYSILVEANIDDHSIREQHVLSLKLEGEVHSQKQQAKCCVCNKTVSDKVKSFCLSSKKFNGKTYCFKHQKSLG